MSSNPSCEEIRVLAPELALGIASGEERARALSHLTSCPECRQLVADLSSTADEILLLAPEREPSVGFENKVLASIGIRRRRVGRVLLAAAALLVAMSIGAGAVYWRTTEDRELAGSVKQALAEANGKYFSVLPLRDSNGSKVANVFAYEGKPSWVFVVWQEPLERDDYTIRAHLVDGDWATLGTFESDGSRRAWGGDLAGSLHEMGAITVGAAHDEDSYTASFHRNG